MAFGDRAEKADPKWRPKKSRHKNKQTRHSWEGGYCTRCNAKKFEYGAGGGEYPETYESRLPCPGEVENTRPAPEAENKAAQKLCEIYFNIAANAIGEDEVRKQREQALKGE